MIAVYLQDGTFCGQVECLEDFEDWRDQVNRWCCRLDYPTLTPTFITEKEEPNLIPPYIMAINYLQSKGELPTEFHF